MKLTTEEIALCVMGLQAIHVASHEKTRAKLESRMKAELGSRGIVMTDHVQPGYGLPVTSRHVA